MPWIPADPFAEFSLILLLLTAMTTVKSGCEYAQEILTQSKLKVLGMVLNGVDLDKQSRYNHYYYSSQPARDDSSIMGSKLLSGTTTNRDR